MSYFPTDDLLLKRVCEKVEDKIKEIEIFILNGVAEELYKALVRERQAYLECLRMFDVVTKELREEGNRK